MILSTRDSQTYPKPGLDILTRLHNASANKSPEFVCALARHVGPLLLKNGTLARRILSKLDYKPPIIGAGSTGCDVEDITNFKNFIQDVLENLAANKINNNHSNEFEEPFINSINSLYKKYKTKETTLIKRLNNADDHEIYKTTVSYLEDKTKSEFYLKIKVCGITQKIASKKLWKDVISDLVNLIPTNKIIEEVEIVSLLNKVKGLEIIDIKNERKPPFLSKFSLPFWYSVAHFLLPSLSHWILGALDGVTPTYSFLITSSIPFLLQIIDFAYHFYYDYSKRKLTPFKKDLSLLGWGLFLGLKPILWHWLDFSNNLYYLLIFFNIVQSVSREYFLTFGDISPLALAGSILFGYTSQVAEFNNILNLRDITTRNAIAMTNAIANENYEYVAKTVKRGIYINKTNEVDIEFNNITKTVGSILDTNLSIKLPSRVSSFYQQYFKELQKEFFSKNMGLSPLAQGGLKWVMYIKILHDNIDIDKLIQQLEPGQEEEEVTVGNFRSALEKFKTDLPESSSLLTDVETLTHFHKTRLYCAFYENECSQNYEYFLERIKRQLIINAQKKQSVVNTQVAIFKDPDFAGIFPTLQSSGEVISDKILKFTFNVILILFLSHIPGLNLWKLSAFDPKNFISVLLAAGGISVSSQVGSFMNLYNIWDYYYGKYSNYYLGRLDFEKIRQHEIQWNNVENFNPKKIQNLEIIKQIKPRSEDEFITLGDTAKTCKYLTVNKEVQAFKFTDNKSRQRVDKNQFENARGESLFKLTENKLFLKVNDIDFKYDKKINAYSLNAKDHTLGSHVSTLTQNLENESRSLTYTDFYVNKESGDKISLTVYEFFENGKGGVDLKVSQSSDSSKLARVHGLNETKYLTCVPQSSMFSRLNPILAEYNMGEVGHFSTTDWTLKVVERSKLNYNSVYKSVYELLGKKAKPLPLSIDITKKMPAEFKGVEYLLSRAYFGNLRFQIKSTDGTLTCHEMTKDVLHFLAAFLLYRKSDLFTEPVKSDAFWSENVSGTILEKVFEAIQSKEEGKEEDAYDTYESYNSSSGVPVFGNGGNGGVAIVPESFCSGASSEEVGPQAQVVSLLRGICARYSPGARQAAAY